MYLEMLMSPAVIHFTYLCFTSRFTGTLWTITCLWI